jgi:hypothetical protein
MDLSIYPISFFVSALALIGASLFAWKHRRDGWGLPMLAVLGTTAVWYHGDGLYNDYESYRLINGDSALSAGWWQVLLFIVTFSLFVPLIFGLVNARFSGKSSCVLSYAKTGMIRHPDLQRKVDQLCMSMLGCWLILMMVAIVRVDFNAVGLFAPYLGERSNPWGRSRMGGGFSALLSLGSYLQILLTAGFGVIAAVSKNPKTRVIAITVCCLAFPYYIFDRTRNAMIATMLPGLLAYVFLYLRGGIWKKAVILLVAFLMANSWFTFVGENRAKSSISRVFKQKGFNTEKSVETNVDGIEKKKVRKHEGLTMFSELGYINRFFEDGTYTPTWGGRYFAEAVNVIPRALWKGKPLVGLDYAIARGLAADSRYGSYAAGVTASVSTGMIGQGVVNFGGFFGPVAAALLMSIWVSILARQDLMGSAPARLMLYAVGMILTFNMGRDITLLVLYPYVFGWLLIVFLEWNKKKKREQNVSAPVRRHRQSPPR